MEFLKELVVVTVIVMSLSSLISWVALWHTSVGRRMSDDTRVEWLSRVQAVGGITANGIVWLGHFPSIIVAGCIAVAVIATMLDIVQMVRRHKTATI